VQATATGGKFSWSNPNVADLAKIVIRRATGLTPPATPSAGTAAYSGTVTDPGTEMSATVRGLSPGRNYAFSVWAVDRRGNVSAARHVVLHGTYIAFAVPRPAPYGVSFLVAAGVADVTTGAPLKGVGVNFYKRSLSSSRWTFVGATGTDSKGVAGISLTTRKRIEMKAVFAGWGNHLGRASAVRTLILSPGVSGSYYGNVPVGETEVVHGTVHPNLAGHRIYLQRYSGGHWSPYLSAVLSSKSTFSWSFTMTRKGTVKFRLYMPKTAGLEPLDNRLTVVVG
jgi:hypothetical protein